MKSIVPIIILLLASPVYAQSWTLACNSDIANRKSIRVGQFLCFDPATNADDSPILDVSGCDFTNWSYHEDKDGSGTSSTVEYTIQTCADPDLKLGDADNGCRQVEGTDVLGSSATDLDEAGIGVGPWLRVQASGTGTDAGQGRIIVTCSSGAGGF